LVSSLALPGAADRLPEGAWHAFNDEVLDLDHASCALRLRIDIPVPEPTPWRYAPTTTLTHGSAANAHHPTGPDSFLQCRFSPRIQQVRSSLAYKSAIVPVESLDVPARYLRWVGPGVLHDARRFGPVVELKSPPRHHYANEAPIREMRRAFGPERWPKSCTAAHIPQPCDRQ